MNKFPICQLKHDRIDFTKRSYLEPEKRNVEVMTFSATSKVILDDATNSAIGVQVERFGETLQYFASNEVILSAGAIGSPQEMDSFNGLCTHILSIANLSKL